MSRVGGGSAFYVNRYIGLRSLPVAKNLSDGDTGGEPNGPESLLWSLIVFGPVVWAAHKMQAPPTDVGWKQSLALLSGFTVGSFGFYGGRVRAKVLSQRWGYGTTESFIAFLWSVSLASPAFLLFEFSKSGINLHSIAYGGLRIASFVFLVWLPVLIFISLVSDRRYGFVRGIVAGLCLEFATLAVTLATAQRAKEWSDQVLGAFGFH